MSRDLKYPERDAEILRRWDEKQSSGAIAKALGVTRNTISGVIHRAGKQRGEPNITEAKREAGRRACAARWAGHVRKPRQKPKPEPKPNRTITMRAIKARQREQAAAQAVETESAPIESLPAGQRRTILTIAAGECRWPHGDPGNPDFHLCGGKALSGVPYCGYHTRVAYRPRGVS